MPARWTRTSQRKAPGPKIISIVCANCDVDFPARGRPTAFCGPRCRAEADAVRYGRRSYAEYGNDLPDDIAYALRIKRAFAVSGGYAAWDRRLTPERRAEVIARDGGLCVLCGEPGEDIDHINGDSDDLSNLRLLCKPCHRQVTEINLVPISDAGMLLRAAGMEARTRALEPTRACDRSDWSGNWRAWVREHTTYDTSKAPARRT